ncbi:hypothetical protein LTR50_001438 [Elasticomyces elasticus]|nr:hypothetical protein LTR50_001438 [Elasticomyces elasticus]
MGYGYTFIKSQLFTHIPYPQSSFSGQTVIVTGSNTGLGLEAARHIVRLDATKVILAVRTVSKGQAAAANIIESLNVPSSRVEVWQLDLSSHESVIAFGKRVQSLDRLDAVIQNAGILTYEWNIVEGEESHIAINVVSPILFGLLVLPKLRETAKATGQSGRLAFVGSDLHYIAKFKEAGVSGSMFDALRQKDIADMGDRYKVSKLLLLYAVRELAARNPLSSSSNAIIDYLTPGACKSDIFRDDLSYVQRLGIGIGTALMARTTEVGSRTLVHGVSSDVSEEAHGAFLMDCRVFPNGTNVDSERGQNLQKLWTQELFERLELIEPGCTMA